MATALQKSRSNDDVLIGGALNKDDLFELLQEQIDILSIRMKSPDGVSRDDLKPLLKAISDLRGLGLGADETLKKAVDFQMKVTRQLVVQQDVKTALLTRQYQSMREAVLKARDINLQTKQVKQLESELLALNKELLKKAEEENDRLRKQQKQEKSQPNETSEAPTTTAPAKGSPTASSAANKSFTSQQSNSSVDGAKDGKDANGSKRFFWRRGDKKKSPDGQNHAQPEDYNLNDDEKNDNQDQSPHGEKKKGVVKGLSRLSFKRIPNNSTQGGASKPLTTTNSSKAAPDASPPSPGSKEPALDDLLLTDNPVIAAQAEALRTGVSEFQRQAQFDRLVEAMQRVKVVMDSPQEKRGPSPILAAAGPDLDLVTGDPNTVHLWLGEWHGVVKASNSANLSSKTILVGEIDSKIAQGRWEIRMAKDALMAGDTGSKSSSSTGKENVSNIDKAKEEKYLSEIESLRTKVFELEGELKTAKEIQPPQPVRAAAPEVQALMQERSEVAQIEARQEEEERQEERRRMASIAGDTPPILSTLSESASTTSASVSKGEGLSAPGSAGNGSLSQKRRQSDAEYNFADYDPDMMTLKELKQFILDNGGSIDNLKDKSDFVAKVREMKGPQASSKPRYNASGSGDTSTTKSASESSAVITEGPKVQDDERFVKYFKMLKVGLDKESVKHKMIQDGLEGDTMVLDMPPDTATGEFERRKKLAVASGSGIKLKDDERFAKYFRMLKVGLTKDAVKHKMVQDGLDPDILDMDPEASTDGIPPPELAPYLKMLQYGVPRTVVEMKMRSNNVDPELLDQFVPKDIPRLDIKVGEDPRFKPFFKMLAVGVPRDAVKQKMIKQGFDPEILDMDPEEFSPVDGSNINPNKKKTKRKKPDDGMQWKKLYWQPVDVPQPGPGVLRTVWTRDFGFELLDHEKQELRNLFSIKITEAKQAEGPSAAEREKSTQILEATRAQNVSILLSKFRISMGDIKRMICTLRISDGLELSADDVKSLLSMLPTTEEAEKLRAVPSEKIEALGQAEKHFLGLMEIPRFRSRIACFLFKLQFNELKEDVEFDIEALQKAVNNLLESPKMARLFSIVLGIGNLLNSCGGLLTVEDGFKPVQGFRLSSLSKLRLAKAHTTNKTALNFFVSILHERQRQVLDFILGETDDIRAAASVVMANVKGQIKSLAMGVKEVENEVNHAESVRSDPEASLKMTKEDELFFDAIEAFFQKSRRDVHDLSMAVSKAEKDYEELLSYFREEANTPPEELFKHLVAFFDDVSAALHENDVARAKAVRKANALEEAAAVNDL